MIIIFTKRLLFNFFILFFLFSCTGYEFTYNKSPKIKEIEKKTSFTISGDDTTVAKVKLYEELGRSGDDLEFLLDIIITKTKTPIVIEKDATVSKTEIKHSVAYSMSSLQNNCRILSKSINTKSNYSSSSSGYSFSTDLSEEEVIKKNLINNIDEFLDYIISFDGSLSC